MWHNLQRAVLEITKLFAVIVVAWASSAVAEDVKLMGDVDRGETIYSRCKACHSLERDRTGPRHCGLFGRRAGSIEGFRYSKAMKTSDIVWSLQTLDAFLENPRRLIPKNRMGYAGIKDAQERHDLIAYLLDQNQSSGICK